jgi:NAD-dependent SIR2 family protein deacetylase
METITDRNVYILGAGFSADAGAPLIHGFLDSSRQLYDKPFSGLDPFERDHFKCVFDFRREMAQAREKIRIDLDDIEQLFGLVEVSHRLRDTPLETRNSMVYLIAKTLQMSIDTHKEKELRPHFGVPCLPELAKDLKNEHPYTVKDAWFRADIYDFFAGLVSGTFDDPQKRKSRQDTIITFNYDLVCEHALRRLGFAADYHLAPESVSDQREPEAQGKVSVLKLHGSTNWGICDVCNKHVVILPNKATDSPSEFRSMTCDDCKRRRIVPLLIPPSWDKSGYADLVAPIWKHAVQELQSATRICVIGYSIPETDAFFKYLITMALAHNHQLYNLIVVDYRAPVLNHPASLDVQGHRRDLVKPRYLKLLDKLFQQRRFLYFDTGFSNFLQEPWSRGHLDRCEMLKATTFSSA